MSLKLEGNPYFEAFSQVIEFLGGASKFFFYTALLLVAGFGLVRLITMVSIPLFVMPFVVLVLVVILLTILRKWYNELVEKNAQYARENRIKGRS